MLDLKKMKTSELIGNFITGLDAISDGNSIILALAGSTARANAMSIVDAIADEIDRRIPVPEPEAATVTTDVITLATSIIRIAEDTSHFSAILDVFRPQGCDIEKFIDTYFAQRVCDGLVALAKAVIHGGDEP